MTAERGQVWEDRERSLRYNWGLKTGKETVVGLEGTRLRKLCCIPDVLSRP